MTEAAGKAKEVVGWATGDRRVEAEGRAERGPAADDDDGQQIEEVADDVRADHGDIPPDGPDAR